MNTKIRIFLGKASSSVCRSFNSFLEAFNGDAISMLEFLIKRNDSSADFQSLSEENEELYAYAEKGDMNRIYQLIDSVIMGHKFVSRSEAIKILILGCGIEWEDNKTMKISTGHRNTILEKLNKDRRDNKFCDMNIIIDDDATYNVHKCILAAASDFFADLFQVNTKFVKILNISGHGVFENILNFLYTGVITIDRTDNSSLSKTAKFLQITTLMKIFEDFTKLLIPSTSETIQKELVVMAGSKESIQKDVGGKMKTYIIDGSNFVPADGIPSGEDSDHYLPFDAEENEDFKVFHSDVNVTAEGEKNNHGDTSYTCDICDETFNKKFVYTMHSLLHVSEPPYSCVACEDKFSTKNLLENHIHVIHVGKFLCDHCSEVFPNDADLANHLKRAHKISVVKLKSSTGKQEIQSSSNAQPNKRKSNSKKERGGNYFPCQSCNSWFGTRSHLTRHMISHTGERKHCCTTCGKLFLKADHLARHERTHSADRPFVCDKCNKKFKTKDNLKRHHLTHTNERPFFCELCAKQFKDRAGLQTHQKSHSDCERECPHCGKCFKQKNRLSYHISRHNNPLICTICGKSFPYQTHLRRHMLLHAGVRPFNCETCGKQFSNAHGLKLHQKKHTGIGLHPCTICERKFLDRFHLQRHMKVHTGEKPFSCEICNRTFSRADNCENHKRTCEEKLEMRKNMQSFADEEPSAMNFNPRNEKIKIKRLSPMKASLKRGTNETEKETISRIAIAVNSDDINNCLQGKSTKRLKLPNLKLVMLTKNQPNYEQISINPCSSSKEHHDIIKYTDSAVVGIDGFTQDKNLAYEVSRLESVENSCWGEEYTSNHS